MALNNKSIAINVESCLNEFIKIKTLIKDIGSMHYSVEFLTKYSVIKACGTIEYGFKTIVSEIASDNQSEQVKHFIYKKFLKSSANPSYDIICNSLALFDNNWRKNFKKEIGNIENKSRIKDSLESLNKARNTFAHGYPISVSFSNIQIYFEDSIVVLECLEKAICID